MEPPTRTPASFVSDPFINNSWDTFKAAFGAIGPATGYATIHESGALGRYLFAAPGLIATKFVKKGRKTAELQNSASWRGRDGVSSRSDWLKASESQDKALMELVSANITPLDTLLQKGGVLPSSLLKETEYIPLLAIAHSYGVRAAANFVTVNVNATREGSPSAQELFKDFSIRLGGTGTLRQQ